MGFGAVCPHPSWARASARRMKTESSSVESAAGLVMRLPAQTETERAVDLRPVGAIGADGIEGVHRAAAHLAAFRDDLEERKVEREIGEHVRAGEALRRVRNARRAGAAGAEAALHRCRDVGRLVVLVLTDA